MDPQKLTEELKQTVEAATKLLEQMQEGMQQLTGQAKDAGNKMSQEVDKDVDTMTQTLQARTNALAEQAKKAQDAAKTLNDAIQSYKNSQANKRAHAAKSPLGDYVPCIFDDRQNLELRVRPWKSYSAPFSSDEVGALIQSITNILTPPANSQGGSVSGEQAQEAPPLKPTQQAQDFINYLNNAKNSDSYLPQDVLMATWLKEASKDGLTADQLQQVTEFLKTVVDQDTYERPTDVSCSFSVLQYSEAKDAFGKRVADKYVGLEVNVRNLNKQNEFLIHDIQIAVDTGFTPWEFGRFQASRDKQLVRGVVQHDADARNAVLGLLQMMGAILTPINSAVAQSIGGGNSDPAINLGIAVDVFQGPVLSGITGIWPDRTTDHLNRLNDLGFSPSTTSKTVVPVQGSVPLVTFLAEKPLEQLPFVRCGTPRGVAGVWPLHPLTEPNRQTAYYPPTTRNSDKEDDQRVAGTGDKDKSKNDKGHSMGESSEGWENCQLHPDYRIKDVQYDDTLTGRFQMPLTFRKWSGAALNIFEHRVFVVVGGVHIQEVSNAPTVDKVVCPVVSDQTVDLSRTDASGNISCTITGSHLNQVASIKLEQGQAAPITGTAAASADGNSATIGFAASQFAGKTGSFELFLTTSAGQDVDAKQSISFAVRKPVIAQTQGADLTGTLANGAKWPVTVLNGDRVKEIDLYDGSGNKAVADALPALPVSTTPAAVTLNFTAANLKSGGIKAKTPLGIEVISLDDPSNAAPTPQITPAEKEVLPN